VYAYRAPNSMHPMGRASNPQGAVLSEGAREPRTTTSSLEACARPRIPILHIVSPEPDLWCRVDGDSPAEGRLLMTAATGERGR
jgi:hypothetical protein